MSENKEQKKSEVKQLKIALTLPFCVVVKKEEDANIEF